MFYLNKDIALDSTLLDKMIAKFTKEVLPRIQKYKNYYDGVQAILNKKYTDDSKPCNKSVINYCKNITDSYVGYIATPGCISYNSEQDIAEVMDILRYNDHQEQDASLLLDALVHGVAAELMYIDIDGKTRFRTIDPSTCFGIYDDSLTSDLMYFVRIYKVNDWDDSDTYKVDVYSDYDIRHYTMKGLNGKLNYINAEPHYFGQCPANILVMPDEKSIFDCIMSLQDSSNEILSAEIDDYSAFCDAYLALEGMDAEADDIKAMKEDRVLILPTGAKAAWLTKNANDAQVENILKRLHDSIYKISQCVDFSSETFTGGVSSGIAIQFKLTGMEVRSGVIEAAMKKALQRRIEIICGIASLKLGEEVFRDIDINFTRNIPADEAAIVNLINSLKGTVSDATLLSLLPFISDVQKEIDAVQEQKQHNMDLYSFGFNASDEDEEDEDGTEADSEF